MPKAKKSPVTNLTEELAQVNQATQEVVNEHAGEPAPATDGNFSAATVAEPESSEKQELNAEEVKAQNIEAQQSTTALQDLDEIDAILAENQELKAQVAQLQANQAVPTVEVNPQPEEVSPEEAALYWEGIIHPDYRLKTIYLPVTNAPSKSNGYDPEYGESYIFTPISVMHKPPGCEHHRRDVFNVRVDQRVVVPAFVAEQLGTRVDAQDFYGE